MKLLAACVAAPLLFATPAPANTLFEYTGYALAGGGTGGNITASVTLSSRDHARRVNMCRLPYRSHGRVMILQRRLTDLAQ